MTIDDLVDDIKEREYHIVESTDDRRLQSPNRAQELRFRYRSNGFSMEPRNPRDDGWLVDLRVESVRLGDLQLSPASAPVIRSAGSSLSMSHPGFEILYENDRRGMRQSFVVHEPDRSGDKTPDNAQLIVTLAVSGSLRPRFAGDRVTFVHPDGTPRAEYRGLEVWDATGRTLPARMTLGADRLELRVDAVGARYPVTVDPISAAPSWEQPPPASITQSGPSAAGEQFGREVAGAGDVNGDGYADVIVASDLYTALYRNQGKVHVYFGGPDSAGGLYASQPWELTGNQAHQRLGRSVAGDCDVNGDGISDVLIGADNYNNAVGAVIAVLGPLVPGPVSLPLAGATVLQVQDGNGFGSSVACLGDLDGDGADELVVSQPGFTDGESGEGRILVFLGGSSGPLAGPVVSIQSDVVDARLGWAVAGAGDIDADGTGDLIVGAPGSLNPLTGDPGSVYVFSGSDLIAGSPTALTDAIWAREAVLQNFGKRVVTGDFQGDGCPDPVGADPTYVLAPFWVGIVEVSYNEPQAGGCGGPSVQADWSAQGNRGSGGPHRYFGRSIAAGDINADGFDDLLVGEWFPPGPGKVDVYFGSTNGLSTTGASLPTEVTIVPDGVVNVAGNSAFGEAVAIAGDTNGDQVDDFYSWRSQ